MIKKISHTAEAMWRKKPWYYGLAYREHARNQSVYVVIPLNKIVSWIRRFWFWLHTAKSDKITNAFEEGYTTGWREANSILDHRLNRMLKKLERKSVE